MERPASSKNNYETFLAKILTNLTAYILSILGGSHISISSPYFLIKGRVKFAEELNYVLLSKGPDKQISPVDSGDYDKALGSLTKTLGLILPMEMMKTLTT